MSYGVYKIRNLITDDFYIGSTKTTFEKRFWFHRNSLIKNSHGNRYLQRAWNKYGETNFQFSIIEECSSFDSVLPREQFYINFLRPKYNICRDVQHTTKGCKLGPRSPEHKAKLSAVLKGKKRTFEMRRKASEIRKGRVAYNKGVSGPLLGKTYKDIYGENGYQNECKKRSVGNLNKPHGRIGRTVEHQEKLVASRQDKLALNGPFIFKDSFNKIYRLTNLLDFCKEKKIGYITVGESL